MSDSLHSADARSPELEQVLDVEAMKAKHTREAARPRSERPERRIPWCLECGEAWPCDVIKAVSEIFRLRALVGQAREGSLVCFWCKSADCLPGVCNDDQTVAIGAACAEKIAAFMRPRQAREGQVARPETPARCPHCGKTTAVDLTATYITREAEQARQTAALAVYGIKFNGGKPDIFPLGTFGEENIAELEGLWIRATDLRAALVASEALETPAAVSPNDEVTACGITRGALHAAVAASDLLERQAQCAHVRKGATQNGVMCRDCRKEWRGAEGERVWQAMRDADTDAASAPTLPERTAEAAPPERITFAAMQQFSDELAFALRNGMGNEAERRIRRFVAAYVQSAASPSGSALLEKLEQDAVWVTLGNGEEAKAVLISWVRALLADGGKEGQ